MSKVDSSNYFIKELSVINKNKFTLQQTKSLYLGLLYELLLNKEIFIRNKDLDDFLRDVFKKKYKEYLFKARPYLASRLLKEVSKEYDPSKINASTKLIILYLEENEEYIDKPSNSSSGLEDDVIGWVNSIGKGNKRA